MTDDVCVCSLSYPACNRHARIVFSSVAYSAPQYFPALSHKRHDFLHKKIIEETRSVLILSTTLSEIFLILRKIQRGIVINVRSSSYKVPAILVIF